MIGQKVVMAVTGAVLVLFVVMHMIGNLKILSGPANINAYAVFLREVGRPELDYGQLLWIVRIVLLICVVFHVTAVVRLTRLNWAARPTGYNIKKNIKTTIAAQTMRWGRRPVAGFRHLPPATPHGRRRGLSGEANSGILRCTRM